METKITVPPGKIPKIYFLAKTGNWKSGFPPATCLWQIVISPQMFGMKWHYVYVAVTTRRSQILREKISCVSEKLSQWKWRMKICQFYFIFSKIIFSFYTEITLEICYVYTTRFYKYPKIFFQIVNSTCNVYRSLRWKSDRSDAKWTERRGPFK